MLQHTFNHHNHENLSHIAAHSPAGASYAWSETAGLLTCFRRCAFPISCQSVAYCIGCLYETYSSGYCSGFSPDSLLNLLRGGSSSSSRRYHYACKDMTFFVPSIQFKQKLL